MRLSLMLSVPCNPLMLSIIKLNFVMLSVTYAEGGLKYNPLMLSVIMLNVVMLSVVAPLGFLLQSVSDKETKIFDQSGRKFQFRIFSGNLPGIFRWRMLRTTTTIKKSPMGIWKECLRKDCFQVKSKFITDY
jgi:hypothetical protein